ncbi:MAG TPA: hypothetical protein VHB77_18075 [Planctomycetaceae bacterium]|nr:hypothetical protein [Planctomycetaceae bacterium]
MRRLIVIAALAACLVPAAVWSCGDYRVYSRLELAQAAISDNPVVAQRAIRQLRRAGAEALRDFVNVHQEQIAAHAPGKPAASQSSEEWQRLQTALDGIAAQKDAHTSLLYWHTDLEAAKAQARAENKPILSLRLLGNLSDELSCANSRFFRTTLYANQKIGDYLREHYVLHWQSVRPVPVVTIDFGDGRVLKRTVTGNSIHYVLDSEGTVREALPGLFGPQAFLRQLQNADAFIKELAALTPESRAARQVEYHQQRQAEIVAAWARDLRQLKRITDEQDASTAALTELTTDEVWNQLAQLHNEDARLDPRTAALVRPQFPAARVAGRIAAPKGAVENPLLRMLANFQSSISLDSIRNEYTLHRQIHEWFAAGTVYDLNGLNERVYADLFLTPSADPWLGLVPNNVYTGLANDGVVQSKPRQPQP